MLTRTTIVMTAIVLAAALVGCIASASVTPTVFAYRHHFHGGDNDGGDFGGGGDFNNFAMTTTPTFTPL